jgi:hypothetical protein
MFIDLLGGKPIADDPNYVGFQLAGQDIGLVPSDGKQSQDSPVAYYYVDDIHKNLQALLQAGVLVQQQIRTSAAGSWPRSSRTRTVT